MKQPRHRRPGNPAGAGALGASGGPEPPAADRIVRSLRTAWNRNWLLALLLAGGTIIAYLPVWHAGFIWDDGGFLVDNPLIKKADGLYRFWFTTEAPDYFPLTSTMLWLEWRFSSLLDRNLWPHKAIIALNVV